MAANSDDGLDLRLGSTIDEMADAIARVAIERINEGVTQDHLDTIRRYVPNWDGKYLTESDIGRLNDQIKSSFGLTDETHKTFTFPDDFSEAIVPVYAVHVMNGFIGELRSKVLWYFGGLNIFQALSKVQQVFTAALDARRRGGLATRKLNPVQEKLACKYITAELSPGVSKTAACDRAAAKLYNEHGIEVSGRTLSRLISD